MIDSAHGIVHRRRKRRVGIAIAIIGLAACVIGVSVYFAIRIPRTTRSPPQNLQSMVSASTLSRLAVISRKGLHLNVSLKQNSLHVIRPQDRKALMKAGAWQHQRHALLFIGAGFCPYCAAMRWPVVLTLLRFGQLNHLTWTRSGAYDVDPNTPTFGFRQVGFASSGNSLHFRHLELMNRQHEVDQRPTAAESALMRQLDRSPYTRFPDGIPMAVIGDRMVQLGAPVSPGLFKGMDWRQVVAVLSLGHGPLWKSVMAETNDLTKAVCVVTRERPSWVCRSPAVIHPAAQPHGRATHPLS